MITGLAVSNIAWDARDDDAITTVLRRHGVAAIEVAPTKKWERPLEAAKSEVVAYRREWEARGFKIVALQSLLYGRADLQLFGDGDGLRKYLIGIIRLGETLGARALVFGSPKNRIRGTMPFHDAVSRAADFFRAIAPIAEEAGATLCFEPNPPEYGCDFVTTIHEAVSLARFVDHPGFCVQGDLGELTYESHGTRHVGEVIKRAAPYIGHFHVSEPELAEIGTGDADVAGALRGLAGSSYAGPVSIEMKQSALDGVERAVKLVNRYLDAAPT